MAGNTGGFETGVNGNTVLTSDAGNANAWSEVALAGNTTCTYSNTVAAGGSSLSCKVANTGTSGVWRMRWNAAAHPGPWTGNSYCRFYIYLVSGWVGVDTIRPRFTLQDSSNLAKAGVSIGTSRVVRALDATSTTKATGSHTIAYDTWYRIEFRVLPHASTGEVEARIYIGESTTITETVSASGINTGGDVQGIRFVADDYTSAAGTMYLDLIQTSDVGWIGNNSTTYTKSGYANAGGT